MRDRAKGVATEQLGADLRSAIARVYARFRSERDQHAIGDAALSVLIELHRDGPLSLKELSNRARVTPGSMSQTVNRLAEGSYAVRSRDPEDGRRVLFTATPDGLAVALAARKIQNAWFNGRLDRLSPKERRVLGRAGNILRRIADS